MTRAQDLRASLDAYVPSDSREATFLDRMRDLTVRGEAAFDRGEYLPGHFTASAFVLSPAGDSVLLILHAKLGLWLQPGGHVEPHDGSVLAAARREIHEEVGMADVEVVGRGLFDTDIHTIPASPKAPAHEHFDVRFLFRARSLDVRAGDDAVAARWVPLEDASFDGSDESVRRAIRRIRARM